MKKIIYLLPLLLLSNCSFGQEYETIVDSTKQWSAVHYYDNYCNTEQTHTAFTEGYRFRGDTIIEKKSYMFLETCSDSLFKDWTCSEFLFRDDSAGSIYIYRNKQEKLLYDYNVQSGDTIKIPSINDFDIELTVIVDSIGKKLIAGKERTIVYSGDEILYVKGFGSNYGGPLGIIYYFMQKDYVGCDFWYYYTLCFHQNDMLLYESDSSCYISYSYTTGLNNVNCSSAIAVFPNPACNIVTIESAKNQTIGKIDIYTLNGKLLLTDMVEENYKKISLNSFKGGIYLIRITNKKEVITQKLIIKKH